MATLSDRPGNGSGEPFSGVRTPELPDVRKRLDQERRKLQNLVSALEGGSDAPTSILKAINEREKTIAQLGRELAAADWPRPQHNPPDILQFVRRQLQDLHTLLKTDPAKVKSEFRPLNLQLTFHPTEAEPRPYYIVKGQCDLTALVFSFFCPARNHMPACRRSAAVVSPFQSARLDSSKGQ